MEQSIYLNMQMKHLMKKQNEQEADFFACRWINSIRKYGIGAKGQLKLQELKKELK